MEKTIFASVMFLLAVLPVACTKDFPVAPLPASPATSTPTPSVTPSHTPSSFPTAALTSTATPSGTPTSPVSGYASPTLTPTVTIFTCYTPVPTAGVCQPLSSLTQFQGSSTSFTYTENPSQNYSVVAGAFPVGGSVGSTNYLNQYVLQTEADWTNYVASSVSVTGSYSMPFDPATQMMAVISSTALNCCTAQTIQQICTTSTQITVYVDWNGTGAGCVDNAGFGNTSLTQSLGVVLPKSSMPVVWVNPCGFPPENCSIAN